MNIFVYSIVFCNGVCWLMQVLEVEGVYMLFGYLGGIIMLFYDVLVDFGLKYILVCYEQGVVLVVNGYVCVSGQVGVCVVMFGLGVFNLVIGIVDVMLDLVLMVCIIGQVVMLLLGIDVFQELDVFGLILLIVKYSWLVCWVEDLLQVVCDVFWIVCEGCFGLVLIDLLKDVQVVDVLYLFVYVLVIVLVLLVLQVDVIVQVIVVIVLVEKLVIYVGGGVVLGDVVEDFCVFVDVIVIFIVLILCGLGVLLLQYLYYLGMLGMYGICVVNMVVQESDLLVVVGVCFDDCVIGKLNEFVLFVWVVYIDVDVYEIFKLCIVDVVVFGNVGIVMCVLIVVLIVFVLVQEVWCWCCVGYCECFVLCYDVFGRYIYVLVLLKWLSELVLVDVIIVCDVGQYQMWVVQYCCFNYLCNYLISGVLGMMGFGLLVVMGVQFVCFDCIVVLVLGDGSFMMNVQELVIIGCCCLLVKIVLLDNSLLGMVCQWQELFFVEWYSEIDLFDNFDFVVLVQVFGILVMCIDVCDDVEGGLVVLLVQLGLVLLYVVIDVCVNVWLLVLFNNVNSMMLESNLVYQIQEIFNVILV